MKGTFEPDGPLWEPVMVRLELAFMLEVDRGEMPVERFKNAQRTYFAKKMLTNYEANRQQRHVHDLGLEHFRVLTVTTTPERVERMLAALHAITGGDPICFCSRRRRSRHPIRLTWRG
jgi:hypothetical protein